jgi:DNA-binding LacI/PurR family transcriptional regulator
MAKRPTQADVAAIVNCGHTIQDDYLAAQQLLDLEELPTAIWAANDLLAIGALRAGCVCRRTCPWPGSMTSHLPPSSTCP